MSIRLKAWQQECQEKCLRKFKQARDFLCVATPGSGKTILSLSIARRMWREQAIRRLIIVVPSTALVKQWMGQADKHFQFDLESNGDFESQKRRAYDGVVITYSRLAAAPLSYRALCAVPTLVIFDEIHHCEKEEGQWGRQVVEAFDGDSIFRLSLSGTPFRTRGLISFLKYDETEDGKLRAKGDHYYGVAESIHDGICRHVRFPTIKVPRIEWSKGDHTFSASLTDELAEDIERARNQAVLDVNSEAVRLLLRQANDQLRTCRKSHPAAGALLLTTNHATAKRFCELLQQITGVAPRYLSEELSADQATDLIRAFDESDEPWLVSVRRVSEGVDIKRLRVLAYLSNIETPSYFRQAIGRVVRKITGIEPQDAYVFVLGREPFLTMAAELEKEQDTPIPDTEPKEGPRGPGGEIGVGEPAVLLSCDAQIGQTILTGGAAALTPDELRIASYLANVLGANRSVEQIALDLRDARTDPADDLPIRPTEPKSERMKRKLALANKRAYALGLKCGYPPNEAAKRIHIEWKDMAAGHHWQDDTDEPELDQKLAWLQTGLLKPGIKAS